MLLLDWITTSASFFAVAGMVYATVITSNKWIRVLLAIGIFIFGWFFCFGFGCLIGDYKVFH
jgi:hypothetical protein